MRRTAITLAGILLFLGSIPVCSGAWDAGSEPGVKRPEKKTQRPAAAEPAGARAEDPMRKIAEPILGNILRGFKFDSYPMYARDFDPALKVTGARNRFFETNRYIQQNLGAYRSREYLGSLNKNDGIIVLWKGVFDKADGDVLITLMLSKSGRKHLVRGLLLQ